MVSSLWTLVRTDTKKTQHYRGRGKREGPEGGGDRGEG